MTAMGIDAGETHSLPHTHCKDQLPILWSHENNDKYKGMETAKENRNTGLRVQTQKHDIKRNTCKLHT